MSRDSATSRKSEKLCEAECESALVRAYMVINVDGPCANISSVLNLLTVAGE